METKSHFERLAAININEYVEKKGGLSYLSWAWALDRLLREDPEAKWEYGEPKHFEGGTVMVTCRVTAFGKAREMHLPVMDHRNKAISNPDAFQVNTAMQRCLVKAIALHGLGLYIYAGEDLPPGEAPANGEDKEPEKLDPKRPNTATQVAVDAFMEMPAADQKYLQDLATAVIDMVEGGDDAYGYLESKHLSIEHKLAIWSLFPSKVRSELKKALAAANSQRKQFTPAELGGQA